MWSLHFVVYIPSVIFAVAKYFNYYWPQKFKINLFVKFFETNWWSFNFAMTCKSLRLANLKYTITY